MPLRRSGFAMLDVLVALLLLAFALAGACTTLIQTMRASRAALLNTRAVDLAADLAEQLHGVASDAQLQDLLAAWRSRIPAVLPVTGLEPDTFASLAQPADLASDEPESTWPKAYLLTLRWRGTLPGELRESTLPVIAGLAGPLP